LQHLVVRATRAICPVFPAGSARGIPWFFSSITLNCDWRACGASLKQMTIMKMLFFSSDVSEVELVSKEFTQAGIPCEIRQGLTAHSRFAPPRQAELWIHDDRDCHKALMLCVQLGIGFSKRPPRVDLLEDIEAVFETAK
jgi:hypothetical protein